MIAQTITFTIGAISPSAVHYQQLKAKKNVLISAAEHFNRSPKEGYALLLLKFMV